MVPTPYSLKLAFIDGAIQQGGLAAGMRLFELLRGRPIRISPPAWAVVSAALVKVRRLERPDAVSRDDEEHAPDVRMFVQSVGFREYVSFFGRGERGLLRVAVQRDGFDDAGIDLLAQAVRNVAYSGKRGGFLQFEPSGNFGIEQTSDLPVAEGFTLPLAYASLQPLRLGAVQPLDELCAVAEWDRISTFGASSVRVAHATPAQRSLPKPADRVLVPSSVPYRLAKATRRFALYSRVDADSSEGTTP